MPVAVGPNAKAFPFYPLPLTTTPPSQTPCYKHVMDRITETPQSNTRKNHAIRYINHAHHVQYITNRKPRNIALL